MSAFGSKLKEIVKQVQKDYPDPKDVPPEVKIVLKDIKDMGQAAVNMQRGTAVVHGDPQATAAPQKVDGIEGHLPPHDSTFASYVKSFEDFVDNLAVTNGLESIGRCIGGGYNKETGCFDIVFETKSRS